MKNAAEFLPLLKSLHEQIRDAVVLACEQNSVEQLSGVAREEEGDTIYAVDRVSEKLLVEFFEREIAPLTSVVLIAEGIDGGKIILPRGTDENEAMWRVIVDPIDGTRGLMYQKRPAWILTGVARNRGPETNLRDIEAAIQTEIPLVKQHLSDVLWAIRGLGVSAERFNRATGERRELTVRSSSSDSIAHGFATITRFFPGVGEEATAIYEEIVRGALGAVEAGKAQCFEDQYISTGGQLYELICGHDRFIADLRPVFEKSLALKGLRLGICCHPYDLATELIAREAGVILTNERGEPIMARLDLDSDVAWVGYANEKIRAQLEPRLQTALLDRQLI